ncbi:MAG: ArdC family protein [Bacteriovoracaceae bacterium]
MQNPVYEKITAQFIEALNKGIIPWKKPFIGNANFISKKEYQGINSLATACKNFTCPYWVTFNQAGDLGGKIKKGEKGTAIVYLQYKEKIIENDLGEEEIKKGFLLRYSTIFNLEQTEGILWEPVNENKAITGADSIIANYKNAPEIIYKENRAYYSPLRDTVNMPKKQNFVSSEEYYCTLFHELVHSTGHLTRLDRPELSNMAFYNSHNYSKEELTAEIGAAFLCHEAGILNVTQANSEAYIASWAKALENDPKMIMEAAGKARRAVGYITGDHN